MAQSQNVFYPIEPDRNFYVLLVFRIPQKRIEIFSSFAFGLPLNAAKRGQLTESPIQLLNALLGRKETWEVSEATRARSPVQGEVTDAGLYTLLATSRLASGERIVLKDAEDLRLRFAASIFGSHAWSSPESTNSEISLLPLIFPLIFPLFIEAPR